MNKMDDKQRLVGWNMDQPTNQQNTDAQAAGLLTQDMQQEGQNKQALQDLQNDMDYPVQSHINPAIPFLQNTTFLDILMDLFFIGFIRRKGKAKIIYAVVLAVLYGGLYLAYNFLRHKQ